MKLNRNLASLLLAGLLAFGVSLSAHAADDCGAVDVEAVKAAFGTRDGDAGYDACADLDGDGVVGIADLNAAVASE